MPVDLDEVFASIDYWARAASDKVAIESPERSLSYAELMTRADRLASAVRARSGRVGVLSGRTWEGALAVYALLRASCPVVPLGAGTPPARLQDMIEQAGVSQLFVDASGSAAISELEKGSIEVQVIGETTASPPRDITAAPSRRVSGGEAYLLFTSGSTGKPKGVRVGRAALASFLQQSAPAANLSAEARKSCTFDFTFDPSLFDLLSTLAAGACLVIPSRRESLDVEEYIKGRRLTHWYSVPSQIALGQRMRRVSAGAFDGLTDSAFIGEPLTIGAARAWAEAAPRSVVRNVYGPTELTVSCAEFRLSSDLQAWPQTANGTVPIGQMYDGLQWCMVEDGRTNEHSGELCVRGAQRLIGYEDAADNAGRFLRGESGTLTPVDPNDLTAADWYRTGDLVRKYTDGLVHLGRLDRQVKARGYRVELGDIEHAARALQSVDAAVAVADGDEVKTLRLAYTSDVVDEQQVRSELRSALPSYMIPTIIKRFDKLPLDARGKIDVNEIETLLAAEQGVR